jgi:hypothetical protein
MLDIEIRRNFDRRSKRVDNKRSDQAQSQILTTGPWRNPFFALRYGTEIDVGELHLSQKPTTRNINNMNVSVVACKGNQGPKAEEEASAPSRAWELLRSMKEQRESLVERWKEGGTQHSPHKPSDTLKETRLCMKELRRNLDQEGQRRRVARRVSIDGSDRTPSTAASTDASSSLKSEELYLHKSIHVPTSGDSPSIVRVTSQSSSSEEGGSGQVSSDGALATTRKDEHLQVPTLQRHIRKVETLSWKKDARPPSRKKDSSSSIPRRIVSSKESPIQAPISPLSSPLSVTAETDTSSKTIPSRKKDSSSIPRRIVSSKETPINSPISPLSVSPLSVTAETETSAKPIVEDVKCFHISSKDSLDELSSEEIRTDVPQSSLNTQEEQPANIGQLPATKGPRTPPRRSSTGLRRPERRVINGAMLSPEKTSSSRPDDAAIVNMSFLDRVIAEMAGASPPPIAKIERPPSPLSSSTSLSGGDESSTTMGEFTTTSETSGWVSTGESTLLGDGMSLKTDRSSLASGKRTRQVASRPKAVSFAVTKPRRPLFVTGRAADALCRASGGHWFIARQSGWETNVVHLPTWKPRAGTGPLPTTRIRLSTDFRCGTYGSLYDIALRSGSQLRGRSSAPGHSVVATNEMQYRQNRAIRGASCARTVQAASPPAAQEPWQFLAARGGIYDTAVQSGFSVEHVRSSYSVTTPGTQKKETMVPEHFSDGHCGVFSALPAIPE